MLARDQLHSLRRKKLHRKMRKWTRSSLGINGPKVAMVVVVVEEAEVVEVVLEEEEVTGKQPALNLIPRILASTLVRWPGSSSLMIRWKPPGRPGRRIHQRRESLAHSPQ
jgi:hypothetical protein